MKKNVRNEESFICAIHNKRHNTNEVLLLLPLVLSIFYTLIGAPIILVLCSVPGYAIPLVVICPLLFSTLFLVIRKRIVINSFIKTKDVSDKVEIIKAYSDDFGNDTNERTFVFEDSEYMVTILYNWFNYLHAIGTEKLKIYRIIYDDYKPSLLAVCKDDLIITDENRDSFEKETEHCILLSDIVNGHIVRDKLYSRITKSQ